MDPIVLFDVRMVPREDGMSMVGRLADGNSPIWLEIFLRPCILKSAA